MFCCDSMEESCCAARMTDIVGEKENIIEKKKKGELCESIKRK